MKRKRKLNLGTTPIGGNPVKSRRVAREVTSKFHTLLKELNKLENTTSESLPEDNRRSECDRLKSEIDKLGGANRYQQASQISTEYHKTGRIIAKIIEKIGMKPSNKYRLKVLEIGAINSQLQQFNWMEVRSIDLNSQHPSIEEVDFFDVRPEAEYDVVVSSMVLNYVPQPQKRGEMLVRMVLQLKCQGCLCLALPVRCVRSKLVGEDWFHKLLKALGLEDALPVNITPKLIFYVMRRVPSTASHSTNFCTEDWRLAANNLLKDLSDELKNRFSVARAEAADSSNFFSIALPERFNGTS